MRTRLLILNAVAALSMAMPASGQTTGMIIGCITDEIGQQIPRATINLRAQGIRLTMVADDRGCYEFRDLSADVYRVTARLLGFDNVTRDQVTIAPDQAERVDFIMRLSRICECLARPTTLSGRYDQADAVVHVRIIRSDDALQSPSGFFTQSAETLEVLKRHDSGGPIDKAFRFLQNQSNGAPDPYDVGQELVLFLAWWGNSNRFSEGSVYEMVTTVTLVSPALLADLRKLNVGK